MSTSQPLVQSNRDESKPFVLKDDKFIKYVEKHLDENGSLPVISKAGRCDGCLLSTRFCLCSALPSQTDVQQRLAPLIDLVVYAHYREVAGETGSNTGRWLKWAGSKRIVAGLINEEEALRREILARPPGTVMVLFPSASSVSMTEFLTEAVAKVNNSTYTHPTLPPSDVERLFPTVSQKPLVILLDATWSLAKSLDRRLHYILSEYTTDTTPYLTKVRLSRSFRGDLGSLRRIGKFEKSTSSNDKAILDDPSMEQEVTKVSTLQAALVMVEEMFNLPEGSYQPTYTTEASDLEARQNAPVADYSDVAALSALQAEESSTNKTLVQTHAHDLVVSFANILRTVVTYYHASNRLQKGTLVPEDAKRKIQDVIEQVDGTSKRRKEKQ
jgi:hypothetical protein